jgi:electron transport complex protein RnfC
VRFKPAGTAVAAGEPVTESDAEHEHVPLAPVAGHIVDKGHVTLTNGSEVPAVLLDTAGSEAPIEDFRPVSTEAVAGMLAGIGPAALGTCIDRLRGAGVWAERWTSPDLLGQLQACLGDSADIVLCNLLDTDRALAINQACAGEYPVEIVAAMGALARLTGASRAWFAIDADEGATVWANLQSVAAQVAGDLRFVPIENHYPQPDPSLLLHSLTGRRLRRGQLPTDQGVLLLDAAAAFAVGRALVLGEPMLRVPLAVHDRAALASNADPAAATHLVSVPVGTPLHDVLNWLDIGHGRRGLESWAGAPLREHRLSSESIIAGGELGIFVAPREPSINPDPCIRCGWCVEGCPVDAQPAALLDAAQRADRRRAARNGLDVCIECGICSYVCPSHLPLLQGIRTLRGAR